MSQLEAHLLEVVFEVVGRTAPFSAVHHARKPIEGLLIESKCFAHFPRGGAVTVGDDVRRHSGAELAVALIYILDRFLSLVSVRQVMIVLFPFPPFSPPQPS